MKKLLLALLLTVALEAQTPAWRRSLQSLPQRPAAGVTVRDIERVEENLRMAGPVFGSATPENWQANRDLVRRTVSYLAAVHAMSSDPQMRFALSRAFRSVAALQWGYGDNQSPPSDTALASGTSPASASRFAPRIPQIENVPEAEKEAAGDLRTRYDLAASQAVVAAQLAEGIQRNLEMRGMSLNTATATSLTRLPVYFDLAAVALSTHQWAEARTNLDRAEYETGKVLKTLGR